MLLAATVLAAAAPAAPPPSCPEPDCIAGLKPGHIFAAADQLWQAGQQDAAEALLRVLTEDLDPDVRAEARFRLAKWLLARGDAEQAAALLSRLLEERPRAAPARLEYARALAALGRSDAALRQLQRAESIGLPEEVQLAVDRISSAIRSTKAWGGSIEAGLAPDTNLNQATSQRSIEIFGLPFALNEDARRKGGVGMSFAGQLYRRFAISDGVNMLATIASEGTVVDLGKRNDVSLAASIGPEFHRQLRPSLIVGRRWFGGHGYSLSYGAGLRLLRPLGRAAQLDLAVTAQRVAFAGNKEQNGSAISANAAVERAFSPTLFGRLGLSASRQDAKADAYSYLSAGIEAVLSKDLGPLSIYGRVRYNRLQGSEAFALFGKKRDDDLIEASIGASWRRIDVFGMNPLMRLTRTINNSSLPIYEFKRTRLELALNRPF